MTELLINCVGPIFIMLTFATIILSAVLIHINFKLAAYFVFAASSGTLCGTFIVKGISDSTAKLVSASETYIETIHASYSNIKYRTKFFKSYHAIKWRLMGTTLPEELFARIWDEVIVSGVMNILVILGIIYA